MIVTSSNVNYVFTGADATAITTKYYTMTSMTATSGEQKGLQEDDEKGEIEESAKRTLRLPTPDIEITLISCHAARERDFRAFREFTG